MSIRPLVILPDAVLRERSAPVDPADSSLRRLAEEMLATMYDAPGIGLAAIQIGVPKRVVVIDLTRDDEPRDPLVMLNPEIVWSSPETKLWEEGCLSIPNYYDEVERPDTVRVRFHDLERRELEVEADGIMAVCLQHEIDHLNGVLFLDHLSRLKKERVTKRFIKALKTGVPAYEPREDRDVRKAGRGGGGGEGDDRNAGETAEA